MPVPENLHQIMGIREAYSRDSGWGGVATESGRTHLPLRTRGAAESFGKDPRLEQLAPERRKCWCDLQQAKKNVVTCPLVPHRGVMPRQQDANVGGVVIQFLPKASSRRQSPYPVNQVQVEPADLDEAAAELARMHGFVVLRPFRDGAGQLPNRGHPKEQTMIGDEIIRLGFIPDVHGGDPFEKRSAEKHLLNQYQIKEALACNRFQGSKGRFDDSERRSIRVHFLHGTEGHFGAGGLLQGLQMARDEVFGEPVIVAQEHKELSFCLLDRVSPIPPAP
jgi:hypothetical protein